MSRPWSVSELLLLVLGGVLVLLSVFVIIYVLMLTYVMSEMRGWMNVKELLGESGCCTVGLSVAQTMCNEMDRLGGHARIRQILATLLPQGSFSDSSENSVVRVHGEELEMLPSSLPVG